MPHDMGRLTGVGHLGRDEIFEAAGDLVGHAVQQLDALIGGETAPLAVEGTAGGTHRRIHLGPTGFGNAGDHRVVEGGTLFEGLAAEAGGIFAADEILG